MTKEIRKETTLFGTPIEAIYEDGRKIGEVRHEETIFGNPIDRTYDASGDKISETRHEETIFGNPIDRTYGSGGEKLSETCRETTIFGTPVKRVYEESDKRGYGGGKYRAGVSKSSDNYQNTIGRHSYSSGSGSYSKSEYQPNPAADAAALSLIGILGITAVLIGGANYLYKESKVPRYKNLEQRAVAFDYKYGQPLQERHTNNIAFVQSEKDIIHIAKAKSYRGFLGLTFTYPLQTPDKEISVSVSIPDEYITQFEKVKKGWFSWFSSKKLIRDGPLFKKLDLSEDGALQSEEIVLCYDSIGNVLEQKLQENGYYNPVDFWGKKESAKIQEELTEKACGWIQEGFLPNYIATKKSKEVTSPITKTNQLLTTVPQKSLEAKVKNADLSPKKFDNGIFSFTYTNSVKSDSAGYMSFQGLSDLNLTYLILANDRRLSVSIDIPNELISGNRKDGLLKNFNKIPVEPPIAKKIDVNRDRMFSLNELSLFHEDTMKGIANYYLTKGYFEAKPVDSTPQYQLSGGFPPVGPGDQPDDSLLKKKIPFDKKELTGYVIARYILDK